MSGFVLEALFAVVQATSSSDDTPWVLLLLGPAGAGAVYGGLFVFYRNTNKSHAFETETVVECQPVTGDDEKVDRVRGTKRTRINGENSSDHRSRVKRLT